MVKFETIACNLKSLRQLFGFNPASVASFLNVSTEIYENGIETGQVYLTADRLQKIENLFGVTYKEITDPNFVPKQHPNFAGIKAGRAELEALAAVNKIANNTEFMDAMLKK